MFEKIKKLAKSCFGKMCAFFGVFALSCLALADDPDPVPDIGVNMGSYISGIGVKLGITIGAAFGLAVAIWLIQAGWRLYKRIHK